MSEFFQQYAARLGFPASQNMARILRILFSDEVEAGLAAAMPGTAAELAGKTGLPEERVREVADRLVRRGVAGHPMKHPDVYRLFPAMIELRDSTVLHPDAPQELFELWEALISQEIPGLTAILKELKAPPMVRVLPVEQSIESLNRILDVDSARAIFQDAELITVVPCACRVQARRNGRGKDCPAPSNSVCMQTNAFARVVLARGLGEQLTRQEALKRIGEAEEAGLVHMVRNNVQKDMFMCNCCSCCCTGLYFVNQVGYTAGVAPSRYRVRLDADACSGCGLCESACAFGAIQVGDSASVNLDRCYGCGNCVIACPEDAFCLEEVRPREFVRVK